MKKSIFVLIMVFAFLNSCSTEQKSNPKLEQDESVNDVPKEKINTTIDVKEKLRSSTCRIVSILLFKLEHKDKTYYVDSDGNVSEDEFGLEPFQITGTGVLLEGNKNKYVGTVAHVIYDNIQNLIINYNRYSNEFSYDKKFVEKIEKNRKIHGIPERVLYNSKPILKKAWIVLPNTTTENIIEVLEQDPYKVPDVCYEVVKAHRHTYLDLAILKVKSRTSITMKGLSIDDFVEEREYKELKERESVISEGYPKGSMRTTIIKPQPSSGIVTKKTAGELQLSLDAESGSSGSFILSERQNKIVGIINKYDPENLRNIFAVPANDFRILFEEVLQSPVEN